MKIRYLLDENLPPKLQAAVLRFNGAIDILRVGDPELLLIFLVLQRQPQLVPEGLVVRRKSQLSKETVEKESPRSENLWDNPPPATEEMKLTIADFKDKYNRSELWDGDFVL